MATEYSVRVRGKKVGLVHGRRHIPLSVLGLYSGITQMEKGIEWYKRVQQAFGGNVVVIDSALVTVYRDGVETGHGMIDVATGKYVSLSG